MAYYVAIGVSVVVFATLFVAASIFAVKMILCGVFDFLDAETGLEKFRVAGMNISFFCVYLFGMALPVAEYLVFGATPERALGMVCDYGISALGFAFLGVLFLLVGARIEDKKSNISGCG